MTPLELIGQTIERLAFDYDAALALAGGDDSTVTMYLPAEWSILTRRVCALITVEAEKRAANVIEIADHRLAPLETCPACGGRLWFIAVDPLTLLRRVTCANCGMACHV